MTYISRKRARKLDRARRAAGALLVALGIAVLVYPLVASQANSHIQRDAVSEYSQAVGEMVGAEAQAAWEAAHAWNQGVATTAVGDPFSRAEAAERGYADMLDVSGNGVIAQLRIPKISLSLPVFQGISDEVLEQGVGHLEETSLPVGGLGTHAVLTAHRGLPSSTLFTELPALEEGDQVLVDVLGRTLAYEVTSTQVVEPDEDWGFSLDPERDQLTLVTCTPFGVNSHRLLVHAERVDWDEVVQASSISLSHIDPRVYAGGVGAGAAGVAGFRWLWAFAARRRRTRIWLSPAPWALCEEPRRSALCSMGLMAPGEASCPVSGFEGARRMR